MKDMTEPEYRAYPAINYSALADFSISQDHALLPRSEKPAFSFGHAFEDILRDAATGTELFNERYFVADIASPAPAEILSMIGTDEDMTSLIAYNKDGSRSKTHKTKHAWIDACMENPGLVPISNSDYQEMLQLRDNMFMMECLGTTVYEILKECEWQKPVVWSWRGFEKKALYDAVLNDGEDVIAFDIKTAANVIGFNRFANQKYWIQDAHYSEGAVETWGKCDAFYFLIAYKEAPFLCEPVTIDGDKKFEYDDLCTRYTQWIKDGKPPKGYLPERKFYTYAR